MGPFTSLSGGTTFLSILQSARYTLQTGKLSHRGLICFKPHSLLHAGLGLMGPSPQALSVLHLPGALSPLWGKWDAATKQLQPQNSKAGVCSLLPFPLLSQSKSCSA